jgi:hypothetical protein
LTDALSLAFSNVYINFVSLALTPSQSGRKKEQPGSKKNEPAIPNWTMDVKMVDYSGSAIPFFFLSMQFAFGRSLKYGISSAKDTSCNISIVWSVTLLYGTILKVGLTRSSEALRMCLGSES